jgi:methionyl aminopeptidase
LTKKELGKDSDMALTIKSVGEIALMHEGGKRLAVILRELSGIVRPGITTSSLDARCASLIRNAGARPAFLGYRPTGAEKPYPATLCVSVNDVVVHGVPSSKIIQEGDVVSLDLGLVYEGWYVDAAVTVLVGNVSSEARRLVTVAREALEAAVLEARVGNTLGDIGAAVERVVKPSGFSIVRSLTGHGIGRALHEDPYVFNTGKPGSGEQLREGMVLAIEPMIAIEKGTVRQLEDESYATVDGSLAAHFEHSVAITKSGPLVLTA